MHIPETFRANQPASEHAIQKAEIQLGLQFPSDYRDFLKAANGGEGFVGESYLALWPVEEIPLGTQSIVLLNMPRESSYSDQTAAERPTRLMFVDQIGLW